MSGICEADLFSVKKKRFGGCKIEPAHVNRETKENQKIVLVDNAPCGDGSVLDVGQREDGSYVLDVNLTTPMDGVTNGLKPIGVDPMDLTEGRLSCW
uniref:Uncharacterized protein n=1 Tax=Cucumis sativus TaxID=3659 RepID=A0A0A0KCL0_CUCSA